MNGQGHGAIVAGDNSGPGAALAEDLALGVQGSLAVQVPFSSRWGDNKENAMRLLGADND